MTGVAAVEGRIRVLLLTDELEVGGTQRQIAHIVTGLDRQRFEPTVAYFRNRSFLGDEIERAGVRVVEISKHGRVDPGFVLRLRRFLRDGDFDVVHCFAFTAELWGALARRLLPTASRPILITSVRSTYDWYTPMQWRLKRWAAGQSAAVIANSRTGGEHALQMMGLPPGSVDVVYNGVAEICAAPVPVASAHGGPVNALFVGRLVEHKNVPVLLRAMKRLCEGGIPINLRIAGDGPLHAELAGMTATLGLEDAVEFLGERDDTAALMAAADFLVLPSLREGLSNVILEAMATGRAVIASAVGGSVELVEPMQTGLLFRSDDDAALADAMRCLVEDRPLCVRLGAYGRRRAAERFTLAAMTNAMQEAYLRCLVPAPTAHSLRRI